MSITTEECGVCGGSGQYDHECDENGGNMTLLMHHFAYVHWDCFDEAMRLRDEFDKSQ